MGVIRCPKCGKLVSIPDGYEDAEKYLNEVNFCPFCGYDGE